MSARILLGEDASGVYGLKVSQPGDNVLSPSEPLLFDSASARSGMVYAGGNSASATTVNWSATKGALGFIPLVISTDDTQGSDETTTSSTDTYAEGAGHCSTTTTSITFIDRDGSGARTATNVKFYVMRLPMQYGKMNDASLWT